MIQKLIKSLLEAKAYPEPTAEVRLVETHVSFIFLTDRFVYKVKKPVDFGFLDFTTLDRRRFYCEEEVRLNRRLCPDIYLGVVELRASDSGSGASFAAAGQVIDYAVKMKRLPEERMLNRLLERGEAGPEEMAHIAAVLAAFHGKAERSALIDACGSTGAIRANWEDNFRQAAPFVGVTVSAGQLAEIRHWVERFLAEHEELFRERVAQGFIRDCDGDLHSGNICLTDEVCIFDCIEFNDRFRYIDTAADLSFLLMDLEYAGRPDLAEALLEAYRRDAADRQMGALLDFYKAQRAFVRGKVTSLRLNQPGLDAGQLAKVKTAATRYFRLARGYTLRAKLAPTLIVTCGLMGSGKSTLARQLSLELGLALQRSDLVRKRLAGLPPALGPRVEAYRSGIYSAEMDQATYRVLLEEAERSLSQGRSIIIDATFRRREDRELFRALARRLGAACVILQTRCPEEPIRQRLEARLLDPAEVSDGRWEHFHRQQAEFEEPEPGEAVVVDGTLPVFDEVEAVLTTMGLVA